MKTFKLLCPTSHPARLPALIVVITAAFATWPAFAGSIIETANLTLTEYSSTSLSLSYTGPSGDSAFSVMNTGTDTWTIQVLKSVGPISFLNFTHDWAEPEDPTQAIINEVVHSAERDSQTAMFLFVRSDLSILQDANGIGGVSPDNTSFLVGTDSGVPIYLTFHDLAQSSEAGAGTGVPESGSTFALFALSGIALFGLKRSAATKSA